MIDINSLDRFLQMQEWQYPTALEEIKRGHKRSHWIWYIFPQLRGLGSSSNSYVYGISDGDEAKRYLEHPALSERLFEITAALLEHKDKSAIEIMGDIDALKLRSSMTLFASVSKEGSLFQQVLDAFYNGELDKRTVEMLNT